MKPGKDNPLTMAAVHKAGAASVASRRARRDAQTHCKQGHAFTPENTRMRSSQGARQCRACMKAASDKYKSDNWPLILEKAKASRLARAYGLTKEDVDSMLDAQGGACAICAADRPAGKGWHVDHCHKTGDVRGILCSRCNVGIGMLGDDVERMLAAAEYLRKHKSVLKSTE
jgi:hypothetical protein